MQTKREPLRGTTGVAVFASGANDAVARRPTDVVQLVAAVLLAVASGVVASLGSPLDSDARSTLVDLPGLFEPLWRVAYTGVAAWAVVIVVIALVRRRFTLVRDGLVALVLAAGVAALACRIVTGAWPHGATVLRGSAPAQFPVLLVASAAAILSAAAPYLARPFRNANRWLLLLQGVGAMFLGAFVSDVIGAFAIGAAASAGVHLAFGAPGGIPTVGRIKSALADLGLRVDGIRPVPMARRGVVTYEARDDAGPLTVKIYGRDARDAQLLASFWRALTYRDANPSLVVRRVQQVEHEAFMTLLAERAGVRVEPVVTAGTAGRGDAVLVLRTVGKPITTPNGAGVDTDTLRAAWLAVAHLHDAGIVHGGIEPDRVRVDHDGIVFSDFAAASVTGTRRDELVDDAQLLVTTAVAAGADTAIAVALEALGRDELAAVVPYLQPAALTPALYDRTRAAGLDLDDLHDRAATASAAPAQRHLRLRRVDSRSFVSLGLLLLATFTLITGLSDLQWSEVADALAHAHWWWVVFALVIAQVARATGAISTIGASKYPLPPGPTTLMQFAIAYINLAIPATAARVAANIRYFQRVGVPAAAAVAIGTLESVAGFIVQIAFLVLLPLTSDAHVDFSFDLSTPSGIAVLILIVVAVAAVAAIVLLLRPGLRAKIVAAVRTATDVLQVLRSPSKAVMLFGANIAGQVLFALAISATARGFGVELPLGTLVLINTIVSLFAGIMPVPGGIGVTEAALVWGLTSVGVVESTALAIAVVYRCVSFYVPPVWGYAAFRRLTARGYL